MKKKQKKQQQLESRNFLAKKTCKKIRWYSSAFSYIKSKIKGFSIKVYIAV